MFKSIFVNHSSLAEILCMLIVAGIIGYFFHYLISRKKTEIRFRGILTQLRNVEMKLADIETLKDKQGLLFKTNKDMTLKINEFDALLGLTSEVDSISKTLNSLNFVSSKEFNQYVHEEGLKSNEYKEVINNLINENDELIKNKLNLVQSEMEKQNESIANEISLFNKENSNNIQELFTSNQSNLDEKLNLINSQINDLNEEYNERFNEMKSQITSSIDKLSSFSSEQDSQNNSFNEKYNNFSSQVSKLDAKFDEKLDSHFSEINSLKEQAKHNAWEKPLENLKNDYNKNINKALSFEVKIQDLSDKFESQDEVVQNLNENFSLIAKQGEVVDSFNQKLSHHSKLLHGLGELENSVVDMKKDVFDLSNKYTDSKEQYSDFDSIILDFNTRISQQNESYDDLLKKYDQLSNFSDKFEKLNLDFKSHKHKEYDNNLINSELKKLRDKNDYFYLELKKQDNELSFLKNQAEQKKIIAQVSKPKKRLKMADKLSIKGIKVSYKNKDDLKLIKGVGPMIEKKMNKLGIYTFEQVSQLSRSDIELVTEAIEFFPGRIIRDNWRGQAKRLRKKRAS